MRLAFEAMYSGIVFVGATFRWNEQIGLMLMDVLYRVFTHLYPPSIYENVCPYIVSPHPRQAS